MARQWYYEVNGKKHGPVSTRELKTLAQTGFFRPSTTIKPGWQLPMGTPTSRGSERVPGPTWLRLEPPASAAA